jgi:phosphatidylinositol glycan class Z
MGNLNWRFVHYLSYLAAAFFALEPSYIHPDEHFQSLQVLTSKYQRDKF